MIGGFDSGAELKYSGYVYVRPAVILKNDNIKTYSLM